jgi:hypothetical protein
MKTIRKTLVLGLSVTMLAGATAALAEIKPEDQITFRQSGY